MLSLKDGAEIHVLVNTLFTGMNFLARQLRFCFFFNQKEVKAFIFL